MFFLLANAAFSWSSPKLARTARAMAGRSAARWAARAVTGTSSSQSASSYSSSSTSTRPTMQSEADYSHFLAELTMVIALLVVLIWMLNREFEINYRLSYHCSLLAAKDRKKILNLKNQADWLLQ